MHTWLNFSATKLHNETVYNIEFFLFKLYFINVVSPPKTRDFTSSFNGDEQRKQTKSLLIVADSVAPGTWTLMWWNPWTNWDVG